MVRKRYPRWSTKSKNLIYSLDNIEYGTVKKEGKEFVGIAWPKEGKKNTEIYEFFYTEDSAKKFVVDIVKLNWKEDKE